MCIKELVLVFQFLGIHTWPFESRSWLTNMQITVFAILPIGVFLFLFHILLPIILWPDRMPSYRGYVFWNKDIGTIIIGKYVQFNL